MEMREVWIDARKGNAMTYDTRMRADLVVLFSARDAGRGGIFGVTGRALLSSSAPFTTRGGSSGAAGVGVSSASALESSLERFRDMPLRRLEPAVVGVIVRETWLKKEGMLRLLGAGTEAEPFWEMDDC
jgi:hypothetical protein